LTQATLKLISKTFNYVFILGAMSGGYFAFATIYIYIWDVNLHLPKNTKV